MASELDEPDGEEKAVEDLPINGFMENPTTTYTSKNKYMESFLGGNDQDQDQNPDRPLDYTNVLDSMKANSKLYQQAKTKLKDRLSEQGLQRTMPHLVNKPLFHASNIVPRRVIQGYQFYENRQDQGNNLMQRNRMVNQNNTNLNDLSSLIDTSMNQVNPGRPNVRLPKLPPLDGKTQTRAAERRSKSVMKGSTVKQEGKHPNILTQDLYQSNNERLFDQSPIVGNPNLDLSMLNYSNIAGNISHNMSFDDQQRKPAIKLQKNPMVPRPPTSQIYRPATTSNNRGVDMNLTQTGLLNQTTFVSKKDDLSMMDEQTSKVIIDKLTGRNVPAVRQPGGKRRSLSIRSRGSTIMENDAFPPFGNILQGIGGVEPQEQGGEGVYGQQVSRLQDVDSFIYLIKEKQINPSEFIYLVKREDDHYNLKLVDFVAIKESVYYTLSSNGVTRYEKGLPVEFITLKDWLRERDQYNHIKQLTFFTQFRAWKTLKKWVKILKRNHRSQIISQLNEKLFIANPIFQQLLMNHKSMCLEIERLRFIELMRLETGEILGLEDFKLSQEKKRSYVVESLQKYSNNLHQNVRAGVRMILEKLRDHIINEMANDEDQFNEELKALASDNKEKRRTNERNKFEELGFPPFLNYVHRSMLRHECSKFLRLAYLLDFMTVEALGNMYLGSVGDFIKKLKDLFNACEEAPVISGGEASKQAIDPLFFVTVDINAVEIPQKKIELAEIGEQIKNPIDFDLMTYAQFEKEADPAEAGKPRKKKALEEDLDDDDDRVLTKRVVPHLHSMWFELSPSVGNFQKEIEYFFDTTIEGIKVVERFSKNKEFEPYAQALEEWDEVIGDKWIMPDNKYLEILWYLKESMMYRTFKSNINTTLDVSFNRIDNFLESYNYYLNFYWRDTHTDFTILANDNLKKKGFVYETILKEYRELVKLFEDGIIDSTDLGPFRVELMPVKKMVANMPKERVKYLEDYLPDILRKRITRLRQWLESSIKKLSKMVAEIQDFIEQKNDFILISAEYEDKKVTIEQITEMYELLQNNEIALTNQDREQYVQMTGIVAQFVTVLHNCELSSSKNNDRFTKVLAEMVDKFQTDVTSYLEQSTNETYTQPTEDVQARIAELTQFEKRVNELENTRDDYTRYEEVLQVNEASNFNNVDKLKTEVTMRILLWKTLTEWKESSQEWIALPFVNINAKELGQKADQFTKSVYRIEKNLPESSVIIELKKSVHNFREAIPVVTALRSQFLKESHWDEIRKILKNELLVQEPDFTLQSLMDLHVADYQEEILSVATQATQEYALEGQIGDLETEWKGRDLVMKNYKEMRDAYILGDVEELTTALEESLATINNILASRYVKNLRARAEKVQNDLLTLEEVIDKWIECQRKWMYLENIFVGPDIKKQLAQENTLFEQSDRAIKTLFKRALLAPNTMRIIKIPNIIDTLNKTSETLDIIEKHLEDYLEVKRGLFPRFYFISNDEILEILAKSQNIEIVQKHLPKLFENINKMDLRNEGRFYVVTGMISAEGEVVSFNKSSLQARGNVETWLDSIQRSMFEVIQKLLKEGLNDFTESKFKTRNDWVLNHHGQVVSVISHVLWCWTTQEAINELQNNSDSLDDCYAQNLDQLGKLTELVRSNITSLQRKIVVALITQDVHARDIVEKLKIDQVDSPAHFTWQQQLRYYWDYERDTCNVKQVTAVMNYGYEYLGATSRLVITPLTDRCWITITGALHLSLGAAPAGPAGTGKTESTKDLAKGLGVLCVVFNCSDQITTAMMSKLFAGLAQQGAWACLDEFNRIDIEVLSVIAQQLLIVRLALLNKQHEFDFEGRTIPLKSTCGVFITMNPGYAGRTELPDNLKVLFRPVAMMIPDYGLIAEIMLFAEGFNNAKDLSKKMVQLYKLSSEQLSQQDHYDFGMRAVKSVLVMAGSLKRAEKDLDEDVVLIRAMRDSNVPKFIKEDLPLFQALIKDLFPSVEIPPVNYGDLQTQIIESISMLGLQRHSEFELKVVQLFETFNVRFGVMVVGPTGSGKSKCCKVLQHAMSTLRKNGNEDQRYQTVNMHPLNPKSISMGELYGEVNPYTQEWQDGLGASIVRNVNLPRPEDPEQREWVVFDGPVDALWIENMNTVLDDNQTLCLANGERIKLRNQLRMLFEVQDLAVASPATVSRCGMVYMNHDCLGWYPYVKSWMEANYSSSEIIPHKRYYEYILHLFKNTVDDTLDKLKKQCKEPIPTVGIQLATNICNILETYLTKAVFKMPENVEKNKTRLSNIFVYAFIWGMGGALDSDSHIQFDIIVKDTFKTIVFPRGDTVFDYYLDIERDYVFTPWSFKVPEFVYSKEMSYSELLVPTADTTKYSNLLEILMLKAKPTFLTGFTGVGKSVIAQKMLFNLKENASISPIFLNFSAQTSSLETQLAIESKLNKKFRTVFGARPGEKIVIFIDDINMPALEVYGAQPPIELLRQYMDYDGFYDRQKLFMKTIEDTVLLCAGAPPGGGRNVLTPRFTRHFNILCVAKQSDKTLVSIFGQILKGFLQAWSFSENVKRTSDSIVEGTVEIFTRISRDLLPTPTRFHYTFNLRDISKVFQGILMIKPASCTGAEDMVKLWIHENCRVFQDRLINNDDKTWFGNLLVDILLRTFKLTWKIERVIGKERPTFGDMLKLDHPTQPYEEIKDRNKLAKVLDDKQEEHNLSNSYKLTLVFFEDAIEHVVRICRILKQPKGNAMLIGVGGSGKQSLARLSSFIREAEVFQIELVKNYNKDSFKEDMVNLMIKTGVDRIPVTFTFTDSQISDETFLEYINNLLNTGEIPNLFSKKEDYEDIINRVRPYNKQLKRIDSPDVIYSTFVQSVQENLHIVLCMSPVGDKLRIRCRKFPSLVNCCTLDWFTAWPEDALTSVALRFLGDIALPGDNARKTLAETICRINIDVEAKAQRFYNELKRKVYNTPKSYLDAIQLYVKLLEHKRNESNKMRYKLREGIEKLKSTNEIVANLQSSLTLLQPQLNEQQEKTEIFLVQLAKDTKIANEKERTVQEEVKEVNVQADAIKLITKEAEADLAKVMPALIEAEQALKALDKREVSEIRSFNNPPDAVRLVMEAVCVLLNEKPDWPTAKSVLMDIGFLDRLNNYDKENVPESLLKKLRVYTRKPEFEPEYVGQKNLACKSICLWARAIDNFSIVNKEVGPKKQRMEEMSKKLKAANKELEQKQTELAEVKAKVEKMQRECDETMQKKEELLKDIEMTQQRLFRAAKLTELLADEGVRWQEQLLILNDEYEKLVGDVFIASAMMSYLGPFTGSYRKEMTAEWLEWIKDGLIPHSEDFSLQHIGGDPLEIRYWTLNALPTDSVSIDNAIMTKLCSRWPLLIDPQIQANKWIKSIEKMNSLTVMKFSDPNLIKKMQTAIASGYPVLIEDIDEELEPSIDPVMQKLVQNHDGRSIIRVGDMLVDYDSNFRLYITTKLSNPHYLPEVCIRATLINFTVTFEGLQDQLLGDVVKIERPDVEKQRDQIVVSVSSLKKSLKELQDKILELLANSKGMILDDQNLIYALDDSKIKSAEISQSLEENQKVEVVIDETRKAYIPVAIRGTILYFVVADLSGIDSMYQYSLAYYKRLYASSIESSEKFEKLEDRLNILIENITKSVYVNVCRGLFEAHKKIFSFLIATSINRKGGSILESEWNIFLRGPPQSALAGLVAPNPHPNLISPRAWEILQYLSTAFKPYERMSDDFKHNLAKWEGFFQGEDLYEEEIPGYEEVKDFKKLLLIRVLKPENLVLSLGQYVSGQLGKFYEESAIATMEDVYVESDCRTPVIFILSQGADPSNQLIKFAKDKGFEKSFIPLSLGQGQGKKAEALIGRGTKEGLWVLLQNCHLAKSWMPSLEKIVENLASNFDEPIHKDFRLFLTSMPATYFPVSVLQNGLKLTTEPPRGLKANLKRSYQDFSQALLDQCEKPELWRKLLFGLSFFHAIAQERRKFGPLGFNIKYEFNESDLDISTQTLRMFLNLAEEEVPWDALIYVTGQINYGGRVTDDWDRVCLLSILKKYYTPDISSDDYAFSDSGVYFAPKDGSVDVYREYIESLPLNDNPEAFGLHDNANIAFLTQESNKIIDAILIIQPRLADGSQEKSSDEIVTDIAMTLMKDVPVNFNPEHGNKKLFERNEMGLMTSLSTFLLQELEKFNILLNVIRDSLDQLIKAIKGLVVMSQELDEMYTAFLNNQLPNNWKKVSYPSLKPLGSWYQDLLERVAFLDNWLKNDQPASYWMSGFFFPQGFITGVLQTHARKYKIPIDKLAFKFKVLNPARDNSNFPPKDGVYINGLFLDGARWDAQHDTLIDQVPGELQTKMPTIHFIPVEGYQIPEDQYRCPVYKTSVRVGVLSTTGQSTNFILPVDLPSKYERPEFWTLRGTALLCQLDY